jgi:hypothetical protein
MPRVLTRGLEIGSVLLGSGGKQATAEVRFAFK